MKPQAGQIDDLVLATCHVCHGEGTVAPAVAVGHRYERCESRPCPECGGDGKVVVRAGARRGSARQ